MNLPIVPITDLTIKDNSLIVATQGRSIWMIDDLSVIHQAEKTDNSATAILYRPKAAYRTKGGARKETSLTEGQNHPNGVVTHFFLKNLAEKDSIKLTYFNMQGDTLSAYSNSAKDKDKKLEVKKSGNTHVWDTRGKGAEKLDGMIFWGASFNGAKAVPGDYKVTLNVNGVEQTQEFKIIPDPRAEASVEDMQAQHDFVTEINATVDKAHQSIKKIRKINDQLDAFTKQYKDDVRTKALLEKAKAMKEKFGEVEKALYQTKNQSGQDPLNFPIRLTNKLGHVASLASYDDFRPTDQDVAVKNELTTKISAQLKTFDELIDTEIGAFNDEFNALKLKYLFVEE